MDRCINCGDRIDLIVISTRWGVGIPGPEREEETRPVSGGPAAAQDYAATDGPGPGRRLNCTGFQTASP